MGIERAERPPTKRQLERWAEQAALTADAFHLGDNPRPGVGDECYNSPVQPAAPGRELSFTELLDIYGWGGHSRIAYLVHEPFDKEYEYRTSAEFVPGSGHKWRLWKFKGDGCPRRATEAEAKRLEAR